MTDKIYRIDVDIHFYLKAENEVIAKVEAMQRIKNNMVQDRSFKIEEACLSDELKEFYFGDKK